MRLFVALEIPDETREALAALIAQLKAKCPQARWVRPAAMHVTLKFIGHAGEEKLQAICDALSQIHTAAPIEMHFRGLGFFPNAKRPRVFWCGIEASQNAASLAADLDKALIPLDVVPETRPFTPHLTLARLDSDELYRHGKPSPELAEIVRTANEMAGKDFGAIRSREFHLFESKLISSGAQYTVLKTLRFAEAD